MAERDWAREEVEATVADYFSMLKDELKGLPYDKTAHRRALMPQLKQRSEGSVEFKHQNISAVLIDLGFPYISGYKPRANFQRLLYEVVSERLTVEEVLLALAEKDVERSVAVPKVDDILRALTDPPKRGEPRHAMRQERAAYRRLPINYLEREARNSKLGLAGEEFVLNYERARLTKLGKERLAASIEHVSHTRGNAEGYDVLSFEGSGAERCIEVKTTKYGRETPFFVSSNELAVSQLRKQQYHLYRVFAFRETPLLFTLSGVLSSTCLLDPSTYIATAA